MKAIYVGFCLLALAFVAQPGLAQAPAKAVRDCPNCPEMIALPGGSFAMGSKFFPQQRPVHAVTVPAFAMSAYEVTFDDYDACTADGACPKAEDEGWGRGKHPVINVSWKDAKAYTDWLAKKTGKPYRLPTEAEFEFAVRAGTDTEFYWGNTPSHDNANYGADQCCSGVASGRDTWANTTAPVGSFPPNAFGLYDMAGNVWQWVEDCYHDSYDGAPADGSAWTAAQCIRVLRGGAWKGAPLGLRSATRGKNAEGLRDNASGFRIARAN